MIATIGKSAIVSVTVFLMLIVSVESHATTKILSQFDHEKHANAFAQQKQTCESCHPFKIDVKTKRLVIPPGVTKILKDPQSSLCHSCHQATGKVPVGLQKCTVCHDPSDSLKPPSHTADWVRMHGKMGIDTATCALCHDNNSCLECHRKFDTIQPKVHSPNYKNFHAIDARVSPASCSSCHRVEQCTDCHVNGGELR